MQTSGGGIVTTVTLEVLEPAQAGAAFLAAWHSGKPEPEPRIGFATPELLWQVLTAERWKLLRTMCGRGPLLLADLARQLGRPVAALHADIDALLDAGLLVSAGDHAVEFPYDAVKVEFLLRAA